MVRIPGVKDSGKEDIRGRRKVRDGARGLARLEVAREVVGLRRANVLTVGNKGILNGNARTLRYVTSAVALDIKVSTVRKKEKGRGRMVVVSMDWLMGVRRKGGYP